MKFGPIPVDQAEGAIVAHAIQAMQRPYDQQIAYRIPKGTVLTSTHVADLREKGHSTVVVAQLEAGDVHEDAAAARLAQALVPHPVGVRLTNAATGRLNIYAECAGVAHIDAVAVNAFNAVHPMITLATLHPYTRVAAGTMIGTVKIISYAVPAQDVRAAEQIANGAIGVIPCAFANATLIETVTTEDVPSIKGREVMAGRLHRLGVALSDRVIVPHKVADLAAAIKDAPGAAIFVLTGSATSDPNDVAPQAVRQAGGDVIHFGMPVDPGNLLFLGKLGDKPVIGLPGCARSPALNGADWVMERVLCGVNLTPADFAAMGVGGLLKEIPTRPKPRRDIEV